MKQSTDLVQQHPVPAVLEEDEEEKKRGRPTDYKPIFVKRVKRYGKMGYTLAQIARELDTHRGVLWEWAQRHEDFADAIMCAREWRQAFVEDLAQEIVDGKRAANRASMVQWMARPMSDYSEKTMVSQSENAPQVIDYRESRRLRQEQAEDVTPQTVDVSLDKS